MNELKFAFKQTFPIFFTYIFIGVAFGMMMDSSGYGALESIACGVFIYAGSMQIVMVPLIKAGASLMTLAVTAFFVNARHIFYGLGFIDEFQSMGAAYPYMVFSLTDETYSILCSVNYPKELNEKKASFYIALINHIYWILGCGAGSLAGKLLSGGAAGMEFSATAFFIVVVMDQFKKYKTKLPAAVGAACAFIFLFALGADNFLIPALCGAVVLLLLLRRPIQSKEGVSNE